MKKALLTGLCMTLLLCTLAVEISAETIVNVMSWWQVDPNGLLDQLKTRFEGANPSYTIEYTTVGSRRYYDQLQTRIAAGEAPDVAMLGFDWIAALADNGVLTDIDSFVRNRYPVQSLFPPVQRSLQWKGRYFALPRDIGAKVFYYNKDHLDSSGVAFPQANWTWDDFLLTARRVQREDTDKVERWGFMLDLILDGYYHWFPTNDSDWFNHDRTQITMTEPRTIETMQFIQDMLHTKRIAPTPQLRKAMKTNSNAAFLSQRTAMYVGDSSTPDPTKYQDLNWGIAPLPMKRQAGTRLWSNLWVIPTGVKNLETSWQVLSFFAGPEGQAVVAEVQSGIPALRQSAATMRFSHPYRNELLKACEIAVPYPVIAQREAWDVVSAEFTRLLNGELPASSIASNIQGAVSALMK